jgi:D-threonate/D-erythronate kinase
MRSSRKGVHRDTVKLGMPSAGLHPDCLLVADDLTGACDAAVCFAAAGIGPATVRLAPAPPAPAPRVLALSTESRDLPPEDILRSLFASAPGIHPQRVFKKIDSTMRGNVGFEVAAAMEVFGCEAAVVCPAFPAMGRVVEKGLLRVKQDPDFGAVDLVATLRRQSGVAWKGTTPQRLRGAFQAGLRCIAVDAVTDQDLDFIAQTLFRLGRPVLWAGSAGLAAAMARQMVRAACGAPALPPAVEMPRGEAARRDSLAALAEAASDSFAFLPSDAGQERAEPLPAGATRRRRPPLFCIGSSHPATLAQQEQLVAARGAMVFDSAVCTPEALADALSEGRIGILRIPRGLMDPGRIADMLAAAAPSAVFASGGDTASLICCAADASAIRLSREIVTGVALGAFAGGSFDNLPVATKSGGFGERDTLVRVADFLHARS